MSQSVGSSTRSSIRYPRIPTHRKRLVTAMLLGSVLAAAGCSDSTRGVASQGWTTPGTSPPGARSVFAARGSLTAARLDLVSGTDSVSVTSADLGSRLFQVTTPDGSSQTPHATSGNGLVTVSLSDGPGPGPGGREVEIVLNSAVAWTVSLDGGAAQERVDLTGAHVRGLIFAAGSSSITALLPPPSGDTSILMSGGASVFLVQTPAGVPTQVSFGGGAGTAIIDGAAHSGIAGGTVIPAPGWSSTADRYTIDNTAGVSSFTLTRK